MSSQYWRDRERDWKNRKKKTEKEQEEEIQEIYQNMLDSITKEIESFFSRYAAKEGISMAEAKKRVKQIEIEEYKRKAKKYVKEKDFSDKANEEMRLYNLTMKVNRLELLKADIGAELVNGTNDLETYYGDQLNDAVMEELERNVSILGPSVLNNAQSARAIIDSSFRNATYSERVWANQGVLRNNLVNIITAGIIQGKNARDLVPQLRKQFDVSRYQAERLLRTELTRARIQVQAESYKAEDIEKYEYIACGLRDCCPACKALDGKIFKVKDMEFGENAPPLHPNCHCATAPYSDRKEYEKWLDGLANGEHSLRFDEWKTLNAQEKEKSYIKETGKVGPCHVDAKLMNSKKYHDKYEGLTRHKAVSESLYQESLKILSDNNDTEFEHIVAIDARTGKVLEKNMDASKIGWTHRCGFSHKQSDHLENLDMPFEVLHNHPNSSLPSRDDILKLYQRKNQVASTITCHDGTVYRLTKLKEIKIDSLVEKIYHDTKVKYQGYSEGAIESKCSESLIKMLNKMGCLDYVEK
jgi:SPP1 gp7 family putative phage head morphogenesis protein|nr:MAG TPA: minor capsid protein [Caudoviricetes sp.]